ncbi:Adenylate kinase 7 [Liparis tanakae]|uniref:Adenylate kinase 7 n=1 Tax=Liparis tanakae TaxID=230148 RepID=A0A4Z2H4D6_9TELE|nr:Adenylate kinase 7 [Liparis tanakae]
MPKPYQATLLSAATVDEEASEEAEEEAGETSSARGEPAFQIVGTAAIGHGREPFLLQQYQSPTRDKLLERLLECDVVVYDISESASQQQIEEATWAITSK